MSNCLPLSDSSPWSDAPVKAGEFPSHEAGNDDPPAYARYKWMPVAIGIMAAGGGYPLLFGAMSILMAVVQLLLSPVVPGAGGTDVMSSVPSILAYGAILGFVGVCWSGLVTLVVMPIFYLFVKSLRWRATFTSLGAICGGLVGFVAVLPLSVVMMIEFSSRAQVGGLLVIFAFGPAVTTVLGQLGGAWGARRSIRLKGEPAMAAATDERNAHPYIQFSLRHLIWITAWMSALLTLIHLSRVPAEFILPLLLAWLVFQTATLAVGRFFFTWVHPRLKLPRLRRANRST